MNLSNGRVLILGGKNSMLGKNLSSFFERVGCETLTTSGSEVDITDVAALERFICNVKPDVVLNCAAVLRDECSRNPTLGYKVNVKGVQNLTYVCKINNFVPVFFSSGEVFRGTNTFQIFREDTSPAPENIYGQQKLEAEHIITKNLDKYYILRFSLLFGPYQNPRNFVSKILLASETNPYRCSKYQFESPTYAPDLAKLVYYLIDSNYSYGTYHAFNPSGIANSYPSRFDLSISIAQKLGLSSSRVAAKMTEKSYYNLLGSNISPIESCFFNLNNAVDKYCSLLRKSLTI